VQDSAAQTRRERGGAAREAGRHGRAGRARNLTAEQRADIATKGRGTPGRPFGIKFGIFFLNFCATYGILSSLLPGDETMTHGSLDAVMSGFDDSLLDDFDQICRIAHGTYQAYPSKVLLEHDRRAAAACIYSHMYEEATRRWADRAGIKPLDVRGRKVWIVGDHAVLRVKKTDEDGKSRNYPTRQDKDYDRGVPLLGLPEPATRVTVGYLLDPTQTQIVRVQVSRPLGKVVMWCAAIVPPVEGKRWKDVTRQSGLGGV
jgi:hypothetical protein